MNMGNPKRSSKFLCLNCMKINELGSGIQRGGHQREKWHIKDLACFNKPCCGKQTKNIEIRWCDDLLEVIIPELSEPPVRTLGATIPENESHIFR